jgi:hypothetical protein
MTHLLTQELKAHSEGCPHNSGSNHIEIHTRPSLDQLNGVRADISVAVVSHQKVDVIGGHHVVQNTKAITLLRLEKPLGQNTCYSCAIIVAIQYESS